MQNTPVCITFASLLCARRGLRDVEHEQRRVSVNDMLRDAGKAWHGVKLNQPDWGDASHCIALGGASFVAKD